MPSQTKTKSVTVHFPEELHKQLKRRAKAEYSTVSVLLRRAAAAYVATRTAGRLASLEGDVETLFELLAQKA